MNTLLYEFTIDDEAMLPFLDIWNRAHEIAHEQNIYEQMCGGDSWVDWRIYLTNIEDKDIKGYIVYFQVWSRK